MVPAANNNYQAQALALLTEAYKGQPNVSGLLAAVMPSIQAVEDAFQALLNATVLSNHPLPGGPWDILDKLGVIVGVSRTGLTDAQFLTLIQLAIRVNRSQGLAEDVLQVVALLQPVDLYVELPPAAFIVQIQNATDATIAALKRFLPQTRSSSALGQLSYTDWSTGTLIFNVTPMGDASSGEFPNAMGSVENV